ncbi:hypothetical protein ACTD5D_40895 [Nocardia takedensis]|uniref:hypothetical protein n=1 Tax=Nocardia takedensis TaxID=259390 RepID=UPI003F76F88F
MDGFQRETVRQIRVRIEYPDGSSRTVDIERPEQVSALVFDETAVLDTDLAAFDVSETDWTRNPTMMIYTRDATTDSGIPCGAADDNHR